MTGVPKVWTASELRAQDFPPATYLLPGLLTQGLTILAGKPKEGKSWLALQWALAVASGAETLDIPAREPREVLYLALEDTPASLQERLDIRLGEQPWPDGLQLVFDWPRMDVRDEETGLTGEEMLRNHLTANDGVKLVIIDTLEYVREVAKGNDLYREDVKALRTLKRLADDHDIALVAIHHLRKSDADDPLDQLSGSTGIAGTADNVLVLQGTHTGDDGATLHMRGRKLERGEWSLARDADTCLWTRTMALVDAELTAQQQRLYNVLRDAGEPLRPKEVARRAGTDEGTTRGQLRRLHSYGKIDQPSRGLYAVPKVTPSRSAGVSPSVCVTSVTIDTRLTTGSTGEGSGPPERDAVTMGVTMPAQATSGAAGHSYESDRRDDMSDINRRREALEDAIAPLGLYPSYALYLLDLQDYPAVEDVAEAVAPLFKRPTGERFEAVCAEMGLEPADATLGLLTEDRVDYDESVWGDRRERSGTDDKRVDEDTAIALLRAKPQQWNCPRLADLPF